MRHILKASKVDALNSKPIAGNYADGEKLYLCVSPKGALSWRYRMELNNKKNWITFGRYPQITLAEARTRALEYSQLLEKGINPKEHFARQNELNITLEELCSLYLTYKAPTVRKKPDSLKDHTRIINNQIIPVIGKYKLSELTLPLIQRKIIQPKQLDTPAAAKRIIITLHSIIKYSVDTGYLTSNFIKREMINGIHKDVERERYLSFDELKLVMNNIYKSEIKIQWKIAFTLILMTMCRKQELLASTWKQINFEKNTLDIPENKTNKPFQVPLPWQAVKLFEILKKVNGNFENCFVGKSGGKTGHNSLNQATRFSGLLLDNSYTLHDLRRTSSTLLGELGYSSDLIELSLNHTRKGMEKIYQRSSVLEKRREMLQAWADMIDTLINPNLRLYDKDTLFVYYYALECQLLTLERSFSLQTIIIT